LQLVIGRRYPPLEVSLGEKILDKPKDRYKIVPGPVTKKCWRRISPFGSDIQEGLFDRVFCMVRGRFKHIHLALIVGFFLFIPLSLAYSLYADPSENVLLSFDMSFEEPGDEDLSTCQDWVKAFVPAFSPSLSSLWRSFCRWFSLSLSPSTLYLEIVPALRC
jgi:hypothetical protein